MWLPCSLQCHGDPPHSQRFAANPYIWSAYWYAENRTCKKHPPTCHNLGHKHLYAASQYMNDCFLHLIKVRSSETNFTETLFKPRKNNNFVNAFFFVSVSCLKSLCRFFSGKDPCRPPICIIFDFQPIRGEVSEDWVWGPGVLHWGGRQHAGSCGPHPQIWQLPHWCYCYWKWRDSWTVPAAGGQRLCILELQLSLCWWLPLWFRYVKYQTLFYLMLLITVLNIMIFKKNFFSRSWGWYQYRTDTCQRSSGSGGTSDHQMGPAWGRAYCGWLLRARQYEIPSWKHPYPPGQL